MNECTLGVGTHMRDASGAAELAEPADKLVELLGPAQEPSRWGREQQSHSYSDLLNTSYSSSSGPSKAAAPALAVSGEGSFSQRPERFSIARAKQILAEAAGVQEEASRAKGAIGMTNAGALGPLLSLMRNSSEVPKLLPATSTLSFLVLDHANRLNAVQLDAVQIVVGLLARLPSEDDLVEACLEALTRLTRGDSGAKAALWAGPGNRKVLLDLLAWPKASIRVTLRALESLMFLAFCPRDQGAGSSSSKCGHPGLGPSGPCSTLSSPNLAAAAASLQLVGRRHSLEAVRRRPSREASTTPSGLAISAAQPPSPPAGPVTPGGSPPKQEHVSSLLGCRNRSLDSLTNYLAAASASATGGCCSPSRASAAPGDLDRVREEEEAHAYGRSARLCGCNLLEPDSSFLLSPEPSAVECGSTLQQHGASLAAAAVPSAGRPQALAAPHQGCLAAPLAAAAGAGAGGIIGASMPQEPWTLLEPAALVEVVALLHPTLECCHVSACLNFLAAACQTRQGRELNPVWLKCIFKLIPLLDYGCCGPAVKEATLNLLLALSDRYSLRNTVHAAGCVGPLLNLLFDADRRVASLAACLLSSLADNRLGRDTLCVEGVLLRMLQALESKAVGGEPKIALLYILSRCLTASSHRVSGGGGVGPFLRQAGAANVLSDLLRSTAASQDGDQLLLLGAANLLQLLGVPAAMAGAPAAAMSAMQAAMQATHDDAQSEAPGAWRLPAEQQQSIRDQVLRFVAASGSSSGRHGSPRGSSGGRSPARRRMSGSGMRLAAGPVYVMA